MSLLTFLPGSTDDTISCNSELKPAPPSTLNTRISTPSKRRPQHKYNKNKKNQVPSSNSWTQFKKLVTCKQIEGYLVHDTSKPRSRLSKAPVRSPCGSMCSFRDVVHGNTRVVHRADNSPESSSLGQEARRNTAHGPVRSAGAPARGMPLRKLSGCYECRMIDPSTYRYPIAPRATVCACSQCGEIFPKIESLEHHQAVRHAVSELGPEDSGRNIVEIIFKSSWMRKDSPVNVNANDNVTVCKIERILKVHNTQRTVQRFEDCRDSVKLRSSKKNPRCAADGNELLRFHCTTLSCALGSRGSSSLCTLVPCCGVCTLIRHGFQGSKGVRTTASSGRAHDSLECPDGRRAMLVCRVIAGRVKPTPNDPPPSEDEQPQSSSEAAVSAYDSAGGTAGVYSNLEDLVVFNPRAILPCFVVIYKTLSLN